MNKFLSIICIFILCFQISFANCKIENREAPGLSEYFSNTNKALQLLTKSLGKSQGSSNNAVVQKFENEGERVANAIVVAYNRAFDWNYVISDFRFNLELPKKSEIPKEVQRDYNLIKEYNNTINKYYEELIKSGRKNTYIQKFCDNFDTNIRCTIADNIQAGDLMSIILKNHTQLKYTFEQIIGENLTTEPETINFTSQNFALELQTYYGAQAIEACNFTDNSFGASIRKRTSKIAQLEQENKDAIQEWKDAWNLLIGDSNNNAYRQIEKDILKKELSRQGVSSDNQTNMLNNLDEFNKTGFYSKRNNPFSNSFNSFKKKLKNELHIVKRETFSDFINTKKEVGVQESMIVEKESNTVKSITENILNIHTDLQDYAGETSSNSINLQSQLINSHLEISESINILTKTCENAVKLCNSQATDKGNCGSCK